jgi:S-methylmethionine-dependent homocysteine/selenocysteine methylase
MHKYEYATVEWLWDAGALRADLPGGKSLTSKGEYAAVVEMLTQLGRDEWEVVTCATNANWLFWTLKRRAR